MGKVARDPIGIVYNRIGNVQIQFEHFRSRPQFSVARRGASDRAKRKGRGKERTGEQGSFSMNVFLSLQCDDIERTTPRAFFCGNFPTSNDVVLCGYFTRLAKLQVVQCYFSLAFNQCAHCFPSRGSTFFSMFPFPARYFALISRGALNFCEKSTRSIPSSSYKNNRRVFLFF